MPAPTAPEGRVVQLYRGSPIGREGPSNSQATARTSRSTPQGFIGYDQTQGICEIGIGSVRTSSNGRSAPPNGAVDGHDLLPIDTVCPGPPGNCPGWSSSEHHETRPLRLAALAIPCCCSPGARSTAPVATGQATPAATSGRGPLHNLLLECNILSDSTIAKVVGGAVAQGAFVGAICPVDRRGATTIGDIHLVRIGQPQLRSRSPKFGCTTENIKIASRAGFALRDPRTPPNAVSPPGPEPRSVHVVDRATWRDPADPCAAPANSWNWSGGGR